MTASKASSPVIDVVLRKADSQDVLEAAQSLSNEIVTGRLVDRLMTIAVEHAGADRGFRSIAAGSWIILQVADQGRGMTPEVLERIFDPFFTTKEAGVGTGLGLSLVLRIVTQYGGAIDVDGALGGGSTFTVYLPRFGEALEEVRGARKALPRGQGQRVMVVDDEEGLLELTTHALLEWGYQPTGFGSAQAAIDAFRARPDEFDVLLTDFRMPGMSGDLLIREARSLRPLLPVILISGYVGDIAQGGSSNEWADEVLTKPLRVSALATSLARVLDIAQDDISRTASLRQTQRGVRRSGLRIKVVGPIVDVSLDGAKIRQLDI